MALRFRRTKKVGPIQLNLGKKGLGWSINLGLFRYGVNSQGRRYISAGIKGTGLYFQKFIDGSGD